MTIAITAGSWVSNGTSLTVTLPASPQAGDLHIIFVGCKPYNTTINDLSGWTRLSGAAGSNGTTASSTDAGSVVWEVFYRYWQSGDGNPTLSLTGVNVALHCSWRIRPTATYTLNTPIGCKGSDTSSGTDYSATMDANPGITTNDLLLALTVIAGNNSSFGTPTLTATGATIGAVTESPATEGNTSTGNDLGASGSYAFCTAGNASAAPVVGWTLGVAQTGGGAFVRLRESPAGQTITVNQVTETNTAQALTRVKRKEIVQVTETELAQAITRRKSLAVAQAVETNLAQAVASQKSKVVGQVLETDVAQTVTRPQLFVDVNQVVETNTAQAVTSRKSPSVAQALETNLAQAIVSRKQKAVAQVVESDTAQAVTSRKSQVIGQVSEIDLAQAIARSKLKAIGQALETDMAQAIASRKLKVISQVFETDLAQAITQLLGDVIQQVEEIDTAQAIVSRKQKAVAQVVETNLAQAMATLKRYAIGQVVESDTAQAVTSRKARVVVQVVETDLAQSLFKSKTVYVVQAIETDLALAIVFTGNVVRIIHVNAIAYTVLNADALARMENVSINAIARTTLNADARARMENVSVNSRSITMIAVDAEDVP